MFSSTPTALMEHTSSRFHYHNITPNPTPPHPTPPHPTPYSSGPFVYADVTNRQQLEEVVVTHGVTRILHLAAVLSATGEQAPVRAMEVNLAGTHNVMEIARLHGVEVC